MYKMIDWPHWSGFVLFVLLFFFVCFGSLNWNQSSFFFSRFSSYYCLKCHRPIVHFSFRCLDLINHFFFFFEWNKCYRTYKYHQKHRRKSDINRFIVFLTKIDDMYKNLNDKSRCASFFSNKKDEILWFIQKKFNLQHVSHFIESQMHQMNPKLQSINEVQVIESHHCWPTPFNWFVGGYCYLSVKEIVVEKQTGKCQKTEYHHLIVDAVKHLSPVFNWLFFVYQLQHRLTFC